MSTKRSHMLKQTCSWKVQICLSMCDFLVEGLIRTNFAYVLNEWSLDYPLMLIKHFSRCNVVTRLARQKTLRKEIAKLKRQKRKLVSNEISSCYENINSDKCVKVDNFLLEYMCRRLSYLVKLHSPWLYENENFSAVICGFFNIN